MAEKKFKQVCKCENCGNEAEMMVTCTLEEHTEPEPEKVTATPEPDDTHTTKGHGVCSHCGSEADMWLDI